jgi:hypothetical protein
VTAGLHFADVIRRRTKPILNPAIELELHAELKRLPPEKQQQVLEYARRLNGERRRGTPGKDPLWLAGTITPEDARLVEQAIEEGCERIDPATIHSSPLG